MTSKDVFIVIALEDEGGFIGVVESSQPEGIDSGRNLFAAQNVEDLIGQGNPRSIHAVL